MNITKFPSLNGLRAISIIMVVCNHLGLQTTLFSEVQKIKTLSPFVLFLQDGHLGVNIFFVISGFLITSLLLQEEKETKSISLKNFYIRRTLRIFPAYYLLLLVYFILQLAGYIYIDSNSWLTAITYTKYFNWDLGWYTSHAWSLSIEEHFYLFWPLVFIYLKSLRKHFAMALILCVPLVRTYIYYHPVSWINDLTIFTRIDAIATGCLLAFYKDSILKKMGKSLNGYFIIAIIVLLLFRYIPPVAAKVGLAFIFIPLGTTHGTIANFLIAIVILHSITLQRGLWFSTINSKLFNYIGVLSYSIYLWQQLFISPDNRWITTFPQNLIFVLGAALFSYYVIEKPFLKLKLKFKTV